jgi:hypothetical protein
VYEPEKNEPKDTQHRSRRRQQMHTKIPSVGPRRASHNPGKAVRPSVVGILSRRAALIVLTTTRRAGQVGSTFARAASDPKIHTETSSAVSSLVLAGKRARLVGVAKAPSDKQVVAQLRRAGRHASKAMTAATHPGRDHRVVGTRTIVTGAGALGGAAYAGWKVYVRFIPRNQNTAAPGAAEVVDADGRGANKPTETMAPLADPSPSSRTESG